MFFCYQGTGGSAQLCKSPVAWSPAALLLCTLYTVFGVSRATCLANQKMERRGPRAQWRRRLFASLEHLESLWFMWEILEAGDRANVVTVPKPTLRKCSWLGKCVCVCLQDHRGTTKWSTRRDKAKGVIVWIHFQQSGEHS